MEKLTNCAQGYCEMYCKKYGHCFGDPGDCVFQDEVKIYEALKDYECTEMSPADFKKMEVAALREQEERRWIPVTERLPEQGERVLATDGGFVGELYVNSRGQWKRYNVNDHSLLMALDILWWMPMPQPPKGE